MSSSDPTLSPAAERILVLVRRQQGTSFVEISKELAKSGFDPKGDLALCHPSDGNLVMWLGVSDLLVDALNELLAARLVHYKPTTPFVYLADGGMPTLPQAQRPPKGGYREPHWLPVVINAGPAPT